MKCIGRTLSTTPEQVTINGIRKTSGKWFNEFTYVTSDLPNVHQEVVFCGQGMTFVLPVDEQNEAVYLIRKPRHNMAFATVDGTNAIAHEVRFGTAQTPLVVPFDHLLSFDVPSGFVEPDESSLLVAAHLLDRYGLSYVQSDITYTGSVYSSMSRSTEQFHLYLANVDDVDAVNVQRNGEQYVEVWQVPFDEVFELMDTGKIRNSGGQLLLEYFRRTHLEKRVIELGRSAAVTLRP